VENSKTYRILLYYKYVRIEDPMAFAAEHQTFCDELDVKGRILVAAEGINGTISGTVAQTEAYVTAMREDPRFTDMEYKIDEAEDHAFRKMNVRPRREIVRLGLEEDLDPTVLTGERLSPKDFYEQLQRDDVVVIDARNDYEYEIGHFRNAIRPDVEAFRDFPEWVRTNLSQYKDRKVLTYCTGGIRCEKFSGFLLKEGFKDVGQLHGGIVAYGKDEDVQGQLFDGKCYVFDRRISVPVNRTDEDVVVGKCLHCGKPEDRYVNCANPRCHLQHICCATCEDEHMRSCSKACEEHPENRYELERNSGTAS